MCREEPKCTLGSVRQVCHARHAMFLNPLLLRPLAVTFCVTVTSPGTATLGCHVWHVLRTVPYKWVRLLQKVKLLLHLASTWMLPTTQPETLFVWARAAYTRWECNKGDVDQSGSMDWSTTIHFRPVWYRVTPFTSKVSETSTTTPPNLGSFYFTGY